MEPLWKGLKSLTKLAKFGPFPRTILCKSCLSYPSWQATSFERPPSWVAFIEGFHCIFTRNSVLRLLMIQCQYAPPTNLHGVNTLRPRQHGHHFADDTFKLILVNENVRISIEISLKFVPRGSINDFPTLVQVMAWRRPGDKPLSEPMMVSSLTHICATRPQRVNDVRSRYIFYGQLQCGTVILRSIFSKILTKDTS